MCLVLKNFIHDYNWSKSDPALMIYTSGTTGKPKGALHTSSSISAQAQMLINDWKYSSSDTVLHALPLHHVHGLVNALISVHAAGNGA